MSVNKLVAEVLNKVNKENELSSVLKDKKIAEMMTALQSHQKRRLKRDPTAPKRAKTAYIFFCAAHRERVKKELGDDASATDVIRALGVKWNELKASKKAADKKQLATYEHLATDDSTRYEREMEAYVPSEGYESRRKKGRTGPKRAVSAYLYFCEHHRSLVKKEHPEMKSSEITARLGQMWNDLKADDKREAELKSFHKKASKDRKRYESEKENHHHKEKSSS